MIMRWSWQKRKKLTYIAPFDDPDVIAGQGTVGMEILRQHRNINAIFARLAAAVWQRV